MSSSIDVMAHVAASVALAGAGDGITKAHPAKERVQGPSAQEILAAVTHLNATLKLAGTKIRFAVDDLTKQTVVTVVDEDTGEVIRQIPSEATLKISENITKLLGTILDKEV